MANNAVVQLRPKQELALWLLSAVAAITLWLLSHTFYVTATTYGFGLPLIALTGFLFWFRLRRESTSRPKWLRFTANTVLMLLASVVVLYALGVATWYE